MPADNEPRPVIPPADAHDRILAILDRIEGFWKPSATATEVLNEIASWPAVDRSYEGTVTPEVDQIRSIIGHPVLPPDEKVAAISVILAYRVPAEAGDSGDVSVAFACGVCSGPYLWRIDRRGDAVVSWACPEHLSAVCESLQRDFEVTELVIRRKDKEPFHAGPAEAGDSTDDRAGVGVTATPEPVTPTPLGPSTQRLVEAAEKAIPFDENDGKLPIRYLSGGVNDCIDAWGPVGDVARAVVVAVLRTLDDMYEEGLWAADSPSEPCLCNLADDIEAES